MGTIIGKRDKQAIVSPAERKSQLSQITKVERRTKEDVASAVTRLLDPVKDPVHTVTSDNGKEFVEHELFAQQLAARFFFAHSYAAYEQGLTEHTNGPIREYFPKSRDFTTITEE